MRQMNVKDQGVFQNVLGDFRNTLYCRHLSLSDHETPYGVDLTPYSFFIFMVKKGTL